MQVLVGTALEIVGVAERGGELSLAPVSVAHRADRVPEIRPLLACRGDGVAGSAVADEVRLPSDAGVTGGNPGVDRREHLRENREKDARTHRVVRDHGEAWLVEPEDQPAAPGTRSVRTAPLLQMVAEAPVSPRPDDPHCEPLSDGDVAEMAALALATEPGPWGPLTHCYGQFYGIRIDGRLAAMAGERMRPAPGLAEVSGVCTWPEFRGRGLAGVLIRRVVAGMVARGDTPFLHSYAGNAGAIALYRSLGFVPRREMVVTILDRA